MTFHALDEDEVWTVVVEKVRQGGFIDNVRVDGRKLRLILRAADTLSARDGVDPVATAIAAILAGFAHYEPISERNTDISVTLAAALAYKNERVFLSFLDDSELVAHLADVRRVPGYRLEPLTQWVQTRLLDDPSVMPQPSQPKLPLALPEGRDDTAAITPPGTLRRLAGVRAYIACPLTGLSPVDLARAAALSDAAAVALSEVGISVHQPIVHTHPALQPHFSPREIHNRDVAEVIHCDLIVAILVAPSTGAGKELAYAEGYRIPQLLLIEAGRDVSRLLEGTTRDATVARYASEADLSRAVTVYITDGMTRSVGTRRSGTDA